MGFFTPWFFAGIGLLGLPLYLHLLKRHKSETQQFSSLMFFEKSTEASLKHRRLDYLLLLALRLILLTLMVLAFSQPFLWRKKLAHEGGAQRLIVIDDSASMAAGDRLATARSEASRLLAQNAKPAAFDSRLRMIQLPDVGQLKPEPMRSSLGEFARALRTYAANEKAPVEVHLFSDLQKSSMPAGFSELRLNPDTKLVLHPMMDKAEPNWTVESVQAPARVREGKGAKVQAIVAGFHTDAARKNVSLEVNGHSIASKPVDVPPSGRAQVEFTGLDLPYGFSKCSVSVQAGDGLPADDRYLFAVERTDPLRVSFFGSPRAELYFRSALDAAAQGAYTIERGAGLERAAFAVLADATGDEATLKRFVQEGGSLLVALGPTNIAAGKIPVTGETIQGSRYMSQSGERYQVIGDADASYPPIAKAGRWDGVHFYQWAAVEPKTSRVVARLSDQTPLLLEQKVGSGLVVVLTSGLENVSNDFPVQPAFVAFAEQISRRLSGWEEASLAITAGTVLDLRDASGVSKAVEVLDPDGHRALSLEESAKGVPLELDRAGFWEVRRGGGKTQMIAVNIDRRESDLEPMSKESAQLWQGGGKVASEQAAVNAAGEFPWSLALWVLGAALAAGLVEALIASRHLSQEAA